ncbi:MFS transporter [Cysteiniphilum sp. JM-1]|uniref:MFS transporter n=1 Tax=Cysteiniphilum sp. JM-1 TaxID=2610891 RepID=UPI0012492B7F|nr:MFS transporter [Cysteiniphilum sp. JM-1]
MSSLVQPNLFSRKLFKGWFFFSLAGIFFLYEFFCRASFGSMNTVFAHDLHLDALTVSSISSAYFLAYSLMQLPVGILIDHFGVRKVGTFAIIVTALGALLFSFATTVAVAWVGRFAIGLGSAFAFAMMFKIILDWFPHQHLGVMGGMTQILGMIGPILAGAPFVLMLVITDNDWRLIFHGVFIAGCVLAFFFFLFVRDKSKRQVDKTEVNNKSALTVKQKLVMLIKIKQVWLIAIFAFFVYPAVEVIGSMSGVGYLEHYFSQTISASAVSFVWLGLGLGSPLVGLLSDRLGRRKQVLLACAVFGVIISLLLNWLAIDSYVIFSILMFLLGVAAGAQTLSFAIMIENVPASLTATAVGFNNMFVLLGAWAAQNVTGIVLNQFSKGGENISVHGYQVALTIGCTLFFAIAFVIGLLTIKETYCKRLPTLQE